MATTVPRFFPLVPGASYEDDWFTGHIPSNIAVGENCVVDSSFCFKHYYATAPVGLRIGSHVTIWRTALSVEEGGVIEIGDCCYLANAALACSERITLGSHVMVAGGVTIADSDFHPLSPAERIADTVVLSPVDDRRRRPPLVARPVVIEDDVWVGHNATILKGVRIGSGALIAPGAIVNQDVPPGVHVAGNPALPVEEAEA